MGWGVSVGTGDDVGGTVGGSVGRAAACGAQAARNEQITKMNPMRVEVFMVAPGDVGMVGVILHRVG